MKGIQDLFKSKELYRILIENSSDAIFFTENLLIIDCNEAAVFMFGFNSKEELNGKFPIDYSPEYQSEGIFSKERVQQLIAGCNQKLTHNFDWKFVKSDGMAFDAKVILNSFEHENRTILHFSITDLSTNGTLKGNDVVQLNGIKESSRDVNEKKNEDAKLELSDSLLQATLDSTADGILVVNLSGQITSFNKQFKATFDISNELLQSGDDAAVMGSVLSLLKNPAQFLSKVKYLYNHAELESFDTIELNDGRIIERYSCPQQLNGQPIGRVWSFRDITDRKKVEQQLYLMAHTIKSINETITITDIDDRLLFVNAAFLKTYGYKEEELIGQHISIIRTPGNDLGPLREIMNSSNVSTWQGEIMNRKKDGTDFLVSLSTSMVQNELGEIVGMVGIAVDITMQKRAEIELRNSEERLRNLIETMPDGVYRSTPDGKFVEVNPAMVKMLGYESKEELMDIDIKTQLYFDPADRESLILEEELEEMGIFRLKKKDGSGIWIEDHGWYVTDERGKIIFHEGISRDITERKMVEMQLHKYSDELKELNATKDKFFSIIAHDLKSPFNSISGLSEIIKSEARELDIATIEQYAGIINSTSLQTFRLLENLLDWARLQQSQIVFRPVLVVLKEIVDEVFELMIDKAQSKKIELLNFIPDQLIISADQDMLKTILRNLVSNALKFSFANGKIEIKAIMRPDEIEIQVKDTGTGIMKEDCDQLFKVGSFLSETGTENEKGTGLGLILCKEFVEKHGGRIWVESEIGKGSTFIFTINQNNQNK